MGLTKKSGGQKECVFFVPGGRRGFLSFQLKLLAFEQGDYRLLEDEKYVTGLIRYLNDLYQFPHSEGVDRILVALGNATICENISHRERSLYILSLFIETISTVGDDHYFQTLSWIFMRWLHQEEECLECHEHICNQLYKLLFNALDNKTYSQITPWLRVLARITKGEIPKESSFRESVERLHYAVFTELMNHPLVPKLKWNRVKRFELDCLYQYFREDGAEFLIRELYTSESKSRRLTICTILSEFPDSIVYTIIEQMDDDPPSYVIRNAVKIIATAGLLHHYDIVRPFLAHEDSRVQKEILAFIPRMPRSKGLNELLHMLEVCSDAIKLQIIPVLAKSGESAAEDGLIKLLEQRTLQRTRGFDGVIFALCRELRNFPTLKVGRAIGNLLSERQKIHLANDTIALAARDCFEAISSL